eukprot:TRINITY_DN12398_c0_g1_i6.p1 TRINITY_DN12398_c0_g1~~TRINITY_DN12398_c0_g1_i6.p1  ORF type:complete len:429 (-),score=69.31 TRINITY_DN12398_c0_g1_i6:59-1345(-)
MLRSLLLLTCVLSVSCATISIDWAWIGGPNTSNPDSAYPTRLGARDTPINVDMGEAGSLIGLGFGPDQNQIPSHMSDCWAMQFNGTQPPSYQWLSGLPLGNATGNYSTSQGPLSPGARSGTTLISTDRPDVFGIFGGYGVGNVSLPPYFQGKLADLWLFHQSNMSWQLVGGPINTGFSTTDTWPGGRVGTSYTSTRGSTVLFGGWGLGTAPNHRGALADLWKLELVVGGTPQWTFLGGSKTVDPDCSANTAPCGRYGSGFWGGQDGTSLFIFGGFTRTGPVNDLWKVSWGTGQPVYQLLAGQPNQDSPTAFGPPGVFSAVSQPSAVYVPSSFRHQGSSVVLLLGMDLYADAWAFNETSSQWAWLGGPQVKSAPGRYGVKGRFGTGAWPGSRYGVALYQTCLLYTSDAADEEDSGDLGGRRIIKKKKRG